jgi:hypothetical protein
MRAVPEAEAKVRTLIEQLHANTNQAEAERWITLIRTAFTHPQNMGGMRLWCREHHEYQIETLQATYDEDGIVRKLWVPGVRKMTSDPYGVRFLAPGSAEPGSIRRFPGNVTLATTEAVFVGYNREFLQVFVYHSVDGEQKV